VTSGRNVLPATIVLDFDGTIALGTGPIIAFAREIATRSGDAGFVERAVAAVTAFEAGDAPYRDGYDAVTQLARADGIAAELLSASYDASRGMLGTEHAEVVCPVGLRAFFDQVGARARLVLATNAPGAKIIDVLASWGVADAFEEMHFMVGKPEGLIPVLREALALGPVLAVGDIAEFDLAPALELGASAALVGATAGHSDAPVTMRGRTLADLYTEISAWVVAASPELRTSVEHTHPTERNS
jgi:phosphoglycolate phosphatase-like HAD superfamily hydrolase